MITGGAICDLWILDGNPSHYEQPELPQAAPAPWQPEEKYCETCVYYTPDVCLLNGKPPKLCGKHEEKTIEGDEYDDTGNTEIDNEPDIDSAIDDISVDTEPEVNCAVCVYAQYKDNEPWCNVKQEVIAPDGWCARFELEVSE
jgi:hypothetical protein